MNPREPVKCARCGVPVELPTGRNGKGEWLCVKCVEELERKREQKREAKGQ
jgi:formylmethanofuran dehydrogenase subunit E